MKPIFKLYSTFFILLMLGGCSLSLPDISLPDFNSEKELAEKIISNSYLLNELNKTKYSKDFVKHLAKLDIDNGSEILAGKLSINTGRYDYSIQMSNEYDQPMVSSSVKNIQNISN